MCLRFLIPGLTGERAVGQRRQTVFVVVLAIVLEDTDKRGAHSGRLCQSM